MFSDGWKGASEKDFQKCCNSENLMMPFRVWQYSSAYCEKILICLYGIIIGIGNKVYRILAVMLTSFCLPAHYRYYWISMDRTAFWQHYIFVWCLNQYEDWIIKNLTSFVIIAVKKIKMLLQKCTSISIFFVLINFEECSSISPSICTICLTFRGLQEIVAVPSRHCAGKWLGKRRLDTEWMDTGMTHQDSRPWMLMLT